MIRPSIVVLDTGSGNVHSAVNALEVAGADVELTADHSAAMSADGLVIPGVGAFGAVMAALDAVGGPELVRERVALGRPVLGICVGMQVLFQRGIERGIETAGIGMWPGAVMKLPAPVLPHTGWNTVEIPPQSLLFEGISSERFYFVHSNAAQAWNRDMTKFALDPVLSWAAYGGRFLAAVEDGPLFATQFHPEKSGAAGIRLVANWLRVVGFARHSS